MSEFHLCWRGVHSQAAQTELPLLMKWHLCVKRFRKEKEIVITQCTDLCATPHGKDVAAFRAGVGHHDRVRPPEYVCAQVLYVDENEECPVSVSRILTGESRSVSSVGES